MSIARLAAGDDLVQMSPTSTSDELSDVATYPTFSRIHPPTPTLPKWMAHMAYHTLGYRRIAIIHVDDTLGTSYANSLYRAEADLPGLRFVCRASFVAGSVSQMDAALAEVDGSHANVVIAIIHISDFTALLDAADTQGLLTPQTAWLFADGLSMFQSLEASSAISRAHQLHGLLSFDANPTSSAGFQRFNDEWTRRFVHATAGAPPRNSATPR